MPIVESFGCLELCLYGLRELAEQPHDSNQSVLSISMDLDQSECFTLDCRTSWTTGVTLEGCWITT